MVDRILTDVARGLQPVDLTKDETDCFIKSIHTKLGIESVLLEELNFVEGLAQRLDHLSHRRLSVDLLRDEFALDIDILLEQGGFLLKLSINLYPCDFMNLESIKLLLNVAYFHLILAVQLYPDDLIEFDRAWLAQFHLDYVTSSELIFDML